MKPHTKITGSHRLKSGIPKPTIGQASLKLSRLIAGKYGVFLRYNDLPALVFRKLSGVKNASNSLQSISLSNYVNFQSFYNSINELKILRPFNNRIVSTYGIHCTKTQKFARFSNPTYIYPETNSYHYATFTVSKTDTGLGQQYYFLKKTNPVKIAPEHFREGKKHFTEMLCKPFSYARDILTSVNSIIFSYILKKSDLGALTSINTAVQDTEKPSFKKTEVSPQYIGINIRHAGTNLLNIKKNLLKIEKNSLNTETNPLNIKKNQLNTETNILQDNNLTKQIILTGRIKDKKKKIVGIYNQRSSFTQNAMEIINSLTFHLQRKLNYITSANTKFAIQYKDTSPFKKGKWIQYRGSLKLSISPVFLNYFDRISIFKSSSLKNSQIHINAKKKDETSKNKTLTNHEVKIRCFREKDNDSYYKNSLINYKSNLIKHIEERKKQSIKVLNQCFLYAKNSLSVEDVLIFSYLQSKGNFVTSTNIKTSIQKTGFLSFDKREAGFKYGDSSAEQFGERKKQLTHALDQYPLYDRNILALLNLLTLSYLEKKFNLDNILNSEFLSLKYGKKVTGAKKTREFSKSISLELQKMEVSYLWERDNQSYYENNLTKQIWERKKLFISTFNQFALFARNLLTIINGSTLRDKSTLGYLQNGFDFKFSNLEHDYLPLRIKNLISALKINAISHGMDMPVTDPVIPGYIYNKNYDMLNLETNRITSSTKRIDMRSAREFMLSQSIDTKSQGINVKSQDSDVLRTRQVMISRNISGLSHCGQVKKGKDQLVISLGNLYSSTKASMISVNNVTFSYLQKTFNLKKINSRSDLIISSTRKDRIFSSTKKAGTAPAPVSLLHQRIDLSLSQLIRNIRGLQSEHILNHDTDHKGQSEVFAFKSEMLLRSFNLSFDNVFMHSLISSKHLYGFIKKNRLSEVDNGTVYGLNELVLKTPPTQKADIFSENKEETLTESISSNKIYHDMDKELIRDKTAHEINMIADRVYKIIERRISIERDWRGLF